MKYLAHLLGAISLALSFAGCQDQASKEPSKTYTSYRDISGITKEEIQAIEALRTQGVSFTYGMTFSTEAFYYESYEQETEALNEGRAIGGYAPRFCQWLTSLFGIPFVPRLYARDELLTQFEARIIDFTGDLTHFEDQDRSYMTDPIARRLYKSFRLATPLPVTGEPKPLRYGFRWPSLAEALICPFLEGSFTIVRLQTYEEAYQQMKSGDLDIFFEDETAEAVFDLYGDVAAEYFFPQMQRLVGLATRNPDLKPFISVLQKYLAQSDFSHLVELYDQGREDYRRHIFFTHLTEKEIQYLRSHQEPETAIKVAVQYDNYPVSFYNELERQWQGIAPDILERINALTGIQFVVANDITEDRPQLLDKLERGEVSLIAQLIRSQEREAHFIWTHTPYLRDQYVLLSRSNYPDVTLNNLSYTWVGSVTDSIYTRTFREWFPLQRNFSEYPTYMEGFNALERGEIDLLMVSSSLLLMLTNYYERPGFKVNFAFDQSCDSQFGFNKQEILLRDIIAKAQEHINTDIIAERWSRRVFDYRGKMARAQVPYLISASLLMVVILILLSILLKRSKQTKKYLEETVHKRTQELEVQSKLAQSASQAKSQFLASMSHEIRTPMNAIIGMSDLMRTDNLDEVQQGYFMDIKRMSKTLLQIINDILDFSKIEAGKLTLVPAHYNIAALYDNICSLTRFTATGKELELRHSLDPRIPAILYGDEVRVRQVITNIISNAIKYTAKGYVDFQMRRVNQDGKDLLLIQVADSGIGIKKEDFPRLFGAFQQFDDKKNQGIIGTGLGLSITKNLVTMMEGEITCNSEYGKGSVFKVYLPLVPGDTDQIEQAQNTEWITAQEGVRILVVDDNSVNLTVALGFLSTHNIQADAVMSGKEAIRKVQEKQYDIVFMDHMMPEMDGIEATRHIRELPGDQYQSLPIIALSANAVSGARESFLAGGMNDFIAKPIEAEQLNRILAKWLPPEKVSRIATITSADITLSEPQDPDFQSQDQSHREFDPLLRELEQIEGLDVKTGLSHTADHKPTYIKILQQFCREFDHYFEAIQRFAGEENWKEYTIQVHGMKGVFANMGVDFLSQWGYKLEKAAKNRDYQICLTETEGFCEAMYLFKEELLKTSLMGNEKATEKIPVEAVFLLEKLDVLQELCRKGLTGKADEVTAELRQVGFSEDTEASLKEITELVDSLDYDMALERVQTLQKRLQGTENI